MKKQRAVKQKKQKRKTSPKYIPIEAVFGEGDDYYIYHLSSSEKAIGGILGFLTGFLVGMIFFRSLPFSCVMGAILIVPGLLKYREYLKVKRQKNLLLQFRDMMESLSASYSVGKNTEDAFQDVCEDLIAIYGENTDIVREAKLIVNGCYNGKNMEDLLNNFAKRSHLDDIESFATIFEVSVKYGGNLKKVMGDTREIINDKIEIEMEIETLLTANKNELNIMILMPFLIMLMLNGMGDMSIVQNTPLNIAVKGGALLLFALAYSMGRKIVDIKI